MELNEIGLKVQKGRAAEVVNLVNQAISEGIPAQTILKEGLMPGMEVIGERFKKNEVFIPEVLLAARAMNMGTSCLKPLLTGEETKSRGCVCIGTVQGDLHDIGKNLCRMMLEGKGFEVIDLGVDVPDQKFVEAVRERNCKIVCLSALLTTTMERMASVVEALKASGLRDSVKVMVGGAPVSAAFAEKVGADAYTSDAATCAEVAASF
ncbi:MAG: corrinoid protein [Bacteroidales bacterium]|nr:corrinoid protein [Bacteroidales bacterium]